MSIGQLGRSGRQLCCPEGKAGGHVSRLGATAALALVVLLALSTPAGAKLTHGLEGSIPVPRGGNFNVLMANAVDNSGGPSQGSIYVADVSFPGEEIIVSKFSESGALLGEFDGSDTPTGSFGGLELIQEFGIAVDGSSGPNSGDLYVIDKQNGVIYRLNEAGEYVCQITGSATPSASECNGLAGSATPTGTLTPAGIVVDSADGDVYVSDSETNVIYMFDATGAYIGQIANPSVTAPSSLALDSTGALYVVNNNPFDAVTPNAVKLDGAGNFVEVIDTEEPIRVAVDPSDDHVYVGRGAFPTQIAEYDPSGGLVTVFGATEKLIFASIAINDSTGRIYATNSGFFTGVSAVEVYGPLVTVPDVFIATATEEEETSATVNGEVDPAGGGNVTSCRFEYIEATSYDEEARNPYAAGPPPVPCQEAMPYPAPTMVSAPIAGLSPSTTYRFRLAGANANDVLSYSEGETFYTKGPPTIEATSHSELERHAANLNATIHPRGYQTQFRFQYIDEASFQAQGGFTGPATRSTPLSGIGEGLKPLGVSQSIGNLAVGTSYRYRAIATSPRGEQIGETETLSTVPIAVIERQWAYGALRSATPEAEIDPLGIETTCELEYVSEQSFEATGFQAAQTIPCQRPLGAGSGARRALATISGLQPASAYRYRFTATNASGTLVGEPKRLTTFGIESFAVEVLDENGNDYTLAGGHPYETVTSYRFSENLVAHNEDSEFAMINAFLKDVITESPPGRVSDTDATPKCPGYLADLQRCPGSTQIGTITIEGFEDGDLESETKPLFNVTSPKGTLSRYSSHDPQTQSDGRINVGSVYQAASGTFDISEEARIVGATARVWGVPADKSHDPDRDCAPGEDPCTSHAPREAFLRNPTSCQGPLVTRTQMSTWQEPSLFLQAQTSTPAMTGCEDLQFEPSLEFQPTTNLADSPTGLNFNVHIPQSEDPDGLATADLKDTLIVPPAGLVINPAVATGLLGCSPAQARMDSDLPANCPQASKIGSAEINTPLLDHPVKGGIYAASSHENPHGSLFAIYIALHDPETGVVIKLSGRIDSGAGGQIKSSFSANPELPFEDFRLRFFAGPRAILRTPPACGTYTTHGTLTPWAAPALAPVPVADSFAITSAPNGIPCPSSEAAAPHSPSFRAGTLSPRAGAHTPFLLRLAREDATQHLASLQLAPPPGLLARLAGVPECPQRALSEAAAKRAAQERADPSCPASTQIGTATIAAGAGPAPFYVQGRSYLAGPYKGAPISLAVIVPALAGPYDLGTVVVRTALHIDPDTGTIEAKSEPIPTLLEGVSLAVRSIELRFDRERFILNPTSCRQMAIGATVLSTHGKSASLSDPFRLRGCERLPFAPKLGLKVLGSTHHRAHPALRAVLRMPKGSANIARTAVRLPLSLFLDNERIKGICTKEQFAASACPEDSIYGYAKAWSPLLDEPLQGPVRMRSSGGRLPNLIADLNGRFRIALGSRIGTAPGKAGGGIRANIAAIPDVPVSKFILTMRGGQRGLLQNSEDLCARPQRVAVTFEGHNGKVATLRRVLQARCDGRNGNQAGEEE